MQRRAALRAGNPDLRQTENDDIGSVLPQGSGLIGTIDANDAAEATPLARLHAGQCILEQNGAIGGDLETGRRLEEQGGVRLAWEAHLFRNDAIDAHVHKLLEDPVTLRTSAQFALEEATAVAMPACFRALSTTSAPGRVSECSFRPSCTSSSFHAARAATVSPVGPFAVFSGM